MKNIKHLSFDLWLTLIKSNVQFKPKRAELLLDLFDVDCESRTIDLIIRNLDKVFDRYNELTGLKYPATFMYQRVLQRVLNQDIDVKLAQAFKTESDNLFLKYPPQLLNPNIVPMLKKFSEKGYTMNISSNTGFIDGKILTPVLEELGILNYFDFCIYSDEINCSKPSHRFFKRVHEKLRLDKKEVLHIGDNPKNDYQGAMNYGFQAFLITNKDYTIYDIESKLFQFQCIQNR